MLRTNAEQHHGLLDRRENIQSRHGELPQVDGYAHNRPPRVLRPGERPGTDTAAPAASNGSGQKQGYTGGTNAPTHPPRRYIGRKTDAQDTQASFRNTGPGECPCCRLGRSENEWVPGRIPDLGAADPTGHPLEFLVVREDNREAEQPRGSFGRGLRA